MSHYWTADDPAAVRQAQLEDWLDDLVEFGPEIVAEACREWRQNANRRPSPAELRELCVIEQRRRPEQRTIEAADTSPTWPAWLYDLWGPASTGIPKREAAMASMQARYRRAEDWRQSDEGRAILAGREGGNFRQIGAALGVTAREYKPTPEQLRAGRATLGLEVDVAGPG